MTSPFGEMDTSTWGSLVKPELELNFPKTQITTKDVVNFIEQYWLEFEEFPRGVDIEDNLPGVSVEKLMQNASFRKMLTRRGISIPYHYLVPDDEEAPPKLFSTEQIAALNSLTNYADTRSRNSKLKELGLTGELWNSWMRDKDFAAAFERISQRNYKLGKYAAREGLTRALERGDVNAIKYFNELHGEAPIQQNVQLMLSRLIEVMQLHIKDSSTLHAIERDFRSVMMGRPVEGIVVEIEALPKAKGLI